MKSEAVLNGVLVVLATCAVTVTGLVLRREFSSPPDPRAQPEPMEISSWRTYASAGHRLGRPDAPVTIVEFSDYQCPFCRELHGRLESFRRSRPEVAVVHRQFPLPGHPQAHRAALASECAAEQGRFQEIQDVLYEDQDSLGAKPWADVAAKAGVPDLDRFGACLGSGRYEAAIRRDLDAGRELHVVATPTLLINDLKVEGALTDQALADLVERARRR
jgi:protein-disulfide isomerase